MSIINENEQGLGEVSSVYISYFLAPLVFMLQKPTAYLKKCFLVIRSRRESFSLERTIDNFSTDTALRS